MESYDLYQELILDHNRNPRNFRQMSDATHVAKGQNPICGDNIQVFIKVENDKICDISFEGSGCAISNASSSLMTLALKGHSVSEVQPIFDSVHTLVTKNGECPRSLGKLCALAGVCEFPSRVKCALLSWYTCLEALKGIPNIITPNKKY